MNMKNEITVIIPFKNEGSEVAATIKSLKEMAYATFYIILINDGFFNIFCSFL